MKSEFNKKSGFVAKVQEFLKEVFGSFFGQSTGLPKSSKEKNYIKHTDKTWPPSKKSEWF